MVTEVGSGENGIESGNGISESMLFFGPTSCPSTLLGPMGRNLESLPENTRDIGNLLKVDGDIFKKENVTVMNILLNFLNTSIGVRFLPST